MISQQFEGGPEGAARHGGQDIPGGSDHNAQSSEPLFNCKNRCYHKIILN